MDLMQRGVSTGTFGVKEDSIANKMVAYWKILPVYTTCPVIVTAGRFFIYSQGVVWAHNNSYSQNPPNHTNR